MTLEWLWWLVIAGSLVSLGFHAVARRQHVLRREALPAYMAGNAAGGLGMICLSGFYLLGESNPLAIASLSAGCALIVLGIGQGIAAARRRS